MDAWEAVLEDMASTAADYRAEGWETIELHPGDVTPLPPAESETDDGRVGFEVVVQGEEFERLQSVVADAAFERYESYRAQQGGVVFLVVVNRSEQTQQAVFVPVYYALARAEKMLERAAEDGVLRTYVRPLSDDQRVVFTQEDPDALFPANDRAAEEDDATEDGPAEDL
jgi:hypothetical protein